MRPDIEKLRGLTEKLRKQAHEMESLHVLLESCNWYWTKTPEKPDWDYVAKAFKEIADGLEDAGLPELLADYERLLRERTTVAVGPNIYRDPDTGTLSILGTTTTGAEQPPAVSEEQCKLLLDQLANVVWENDENTIKNRYTFERALRIADKLLPVVSRVRACERERAAQVADEWNNAIKNGDRVTEARHIRAALSCVANEIRKGDQRS